MAGIVAAPLRGMPKPETVECGAEMDLAMIEREVRLEEQYQREGHAARTVVREQDLRIVLIAMKPDARIPQHRASATVSIHVLRGHVRLQLRDRRVELSAGQLLVLAGGLEHDVEALDEAALLLTLGPPD
jgi:quercetin dioxygenase-like cupin family protein